MIKKQNQISLGPNRRGFLAGCAACAARSVAIVYRRLSLTHGPSVIYRLVFERPDGGAS